MTSHSLLPTPGTVTDVFDRDRPPVLTIDPGDTVVAGRSTPRGTCPGSGGPGMPGPACSAPAGGTA